MSAPDVQHFRAPNNHAPRPPFHPLNILLLLVALLLAAASYRFVSALLAEPEPITVEQAAGAAAAAELARLQNELIMAQDEIAILLEDIEILQSRGGEGETAVSDLEAQLSSLTLERNQLQNALQAAAGNIQTLQSEQASIDVFNAVVVGQLARLPTTDIVNENMVVVFKQLNDREVSWSVPYADVEAAITAGNQNPVQLVRVETRHEMVGYTIEAPFYAKSDPFVSLMNDLKTHNTTDEHVLRDAWSLVSQLEVHSYQVQETPVFPLETLLIGGGDDEDLGILLGSLLHAAPIDWTITFWFTEIDNINNPAAPIDLVLEIEHEDFHYVIDPTDPTLTPIFTSEENISINGWDYTLQE